MDNTDRLIQEFSSSVDKELELQKDINEFAKEIAGRLTKDINGEGLLAKFNGSNLSIKVFASQNTYGKVVFSVKLLDLEKCKQAAQFSTLDSAKIVKSFNFEHDKDNELEDEIRNVLVLALLDHYGFDFNVDDLGEEEMVSVKK